MENRIETEQYYWFHKSWDKKRNKESFVSNDECGKIIISDRIPDFEGKYKIAEVKKLADNYSIVSLGDREKPEDLFSGIGLEDAIDVLKKFGFEVFVRDYDYYTCMLRSDWYDKDEKICVQEHQIIAWHHKLGVFINGGTWDSGTRFNNLNIICPNIFGMLVGHSYMGLYISSMSSKQIMIDVVNCHNNHILSFIIGSLKRMSTNKRIEVSNNINGDKSYYDLNNYDIRGNSLEETLVQCKKIYDMLPASGKRFMDDHVFVRND